MVTLGETWPAQTIALAQSSFFGVGGTAFRTEFQKAGYVDTVAFGAYRREVFEWIGSFDEELVRNQDDEFNFRLTQAGGKIWLDPSIRSVYYSRANLLRLWRQYFQYGFYKVRVIQKRQAIPSWRHLVPGIFVLGLMGSLLLALITRRRRWAVVVAGPYILANGLASLLTARRNWTALPGLPFAFLTLHLSYGLGFLVSALRNLQCKNRRT
jgi:GT2 family glycosyltransferase